MNKASADERAQHIAALEAHIGETAYTEKDLDKAERELLRAFRTTAQASESTSAFFAGMYKTENKKFLDGKMPDYLNDPNYPGERRDRWATQVHTKESPPAKFSRAPMDQQDYLYASVHRVINGLPERYLVFIKAQYMAQGRERGGYLTRLVETLWRDRQDKIEGGLNRAVLHFFVEVIVASGGAKERYVLDMIKSKIDVKKATWHRNYMPQWRATQDEYQLLRQRSLSAFLANS